MQKILFICLNYFENGPRAIRTRAIVRVLSNQYDVHVLCLASQQSVDNNHDGYTLHTIPVSIFGRMIRFKTSPTAAAKSKGKIVYIRSGTEANCVTGVSEQIIRSRRFCH